VKIEDYEKEIEALVDQIEPAIKALTDKNDKLLLIAERIEPAIKALADKNDNLVRENKRLQDECESLWNMLEEIKKADVEEHTHLLDELELEMKLQALMSTTKKGIC